MQFVTISNYLKLLLKIWPALISCASLDHSDHRSSPLIDDRLLVIFIFIFGLIHWWHREDASCWTSLSYILDSAQRCQRTAIDSFHSFTRSPLPLVPNVERRFWVAVSQVKEAAILEWYRQKRLQVSLTLPNQLWKKLCGEKRL